MKRSVCCSLVVALGAHAGAVASIDLSRYQLTGRHALPAVTAAEASAVTYNWDTGTLFVVGDEGTAIVEVSTTGAQLSVMSLTGFADTEGLTYVGGGRFVVAEERIQDLFEVTYAAGGTAARGTLRTVSLGDTVGNVGIEGASFDPRDGSFVAVKEKTPERVMRAAADFGAGTATVSDLFTPMLSVLDLSDVQCLSVVPSLLGTADADNLLIFSQESQRLLEVTRDGTILSQFDFTGLADNAEGVTIGPDGTIYIVGETPELFVLTPVPAPGAGVLALGGVLLAARRRR
jgi:uncharacterized protein YjiK